MAIFAVGLFVTCVSILRIYFISHLPLPSMDISWAVVNANIWTAVELNVGIICGKSDAFTLRHAGPYWH